MCRKAGRCGCLRWIDAMKSCGGGCPQSGDCRQMAGGGVIENAPVAGHQGRIRHARGGHDQPVSRIR